MAACDDRLDLAEPQRPLDRRALAEAALARAAAHDLDGDAVLHALDVRHDRGAWAAARRPGRPTTAGSIALGHAVAQRPQRRRPAAASYSRLVEPRHVDVRQPPAISASSRLAVACPTASARSHSVAHPRQRLFAVADDEQVDEPGHRLGIRPRTARRRSPADARACAPRPPAGCRPGRASSARCV